MLERRYVCQSNRGAILREKRMCSVWFVSTQLLSCVEANVVLFVSAMKVRQGTKWFVVLVLAIGFVAMISACGEIWVDLGSDCPPGVEGECCVCPIPDVCPDGPPPLPPSCLDGGTEGG